MIAALLVLLPIAALTTWAFFRYVPAGGEPCALRRFNLWALVAALVIGATWSLRTYLVMSATEDAAWWPLISLLGVLVIVPGVLAVAGVVRSIFLSRRGIRRSAE